MLKQEEDEDNDKFKRETMLHEENEEAYFEQLVKKFENCHTFTKMQVGGRSDSAVEVRGIRKNSKKMAESFLPWRKKMDSEGQGGSSNGMQISSRGNSKQTKRKSTDIPRMANYEGVYSGKGGHSLTNDSSEERIRQVKAFEAPEIVVDEECDEGPRSALTGTSKLNSLNFPSRGKQDCFEKEHRFVTSSTIATRTVPKEIYIRNQERRFVVLQGVRRRDVEEKSPQSDCKNLGNRRFQSTSSERVHLDEEDFVEKSHDSRYVQVEEEENVLDDNDDDFGDEKEEGLATNSESERITFSSYRDYVEDKALSYHEETEEAHARHLVGPVHVDVERDIKDLEYRTEAEKKKYRRQERAWLEKEGEVCSKKGLPRNFLLVDEFTKQPYGVGVGDWKKELMLLSRDLDPAIGNINRQPEGAVEEIVEWIQHTWEYSSPIKFEYVKEVVARGVTLRRGQLWKKIRKGETKPSGLSDRTWRTLERQLENPVSILKSENCRKANASRVNYGRTDPSGEAGVRQKLRRILRRSPHPEEISREMSRNKGFGGRQRLKDVNFNVMQGTGSQRQLSAEGHNVRKRTTKSQEEETEDYDDEEPMEKRKKDSDMECQKLKGTADEEGKESVFSMSADQICQHPFVAMMMKRLEALESRRVDTRGEEEHQLSIEECPVPCDDVNRARSSEGVHELQDVPKEVCAEEGDGSRKSRRLKKKGKEV